MRDYPTTILPCPLGCVNAVMQALDLDAERVVENVEAANLIAFDISAKNSRCKDLRVLARSVEHLRETGRPLVMEWPEIFRLLVPPGQLFVRGTEIARSLNCSRVHVENLILAKLLQPSKESRQGRGNSAIVPRSSYENFLIGRLQ